MEWYVIMYHTYNTDRSIHKCPLTILLRSPEIHFLAIRHTDKHILMHRKKKIINIDRGRLMSCKSTHSWFSFCSVSVTVSTHHKAKGAKGKGTREGRGGKRWGAGRWQGAGVVSGGWGWGGVGGRGGVSGGVGWGEGVWGWGGPFSSGAGFSKPLRLTKAGLSD